MNVGILNLQGGVIEHANAVTRLGHEVLFMRYPYQLDLVDALIIPGGESTTIGMFMSERGFIEPIKRRAKEGMKIFGTCAGLILLCTNVEGRCYSNIPLFPATVKRNAFGRQKDSFTMDLSVPVIGDPPFKGIFIRAPYIESVGPNVNVLCKIDDKIVMAEYKNFLVCAFHPELTDDLRIHKYFLGVS